MKKTKILAPALGILCLSMAASVTGTVAWFSAVSEVTAEGTVITATTASNLYIYNSVYETGDFDTTAPVNAATVTGAAERHIDHLGNNQDTITEGVYTNDVIMDAASTDVGTASKEFIDWYVVDDKVKVPFGGGPFTTAPEEGALKKYTIGATEPTVNFETVKGYVLVARCYFVLEAADTASQKIKTTCNIVANDDAKKALLPAVRVGVTWEGEDGATALNSGCFSSATNGAKSVTSVTTISAAAYTTSQGSYTTTAAMTPNKLYTFTAYMWFEGQDNACTNANSLKSDSYAIDFKFNAVSA